MNWEKVVANLREQSNYYTQQARRYGTMSGYGSLVDQYRQSADVASIMASALSAGLDTIADEQLTKGERDVR